GMGNLFIADNGGNNSNRIRKIAADSGIITAVAGNGRQGFSGDGGPAISASFDFLGLPAGISVDGAGNIFITQLNNTRIRKIEAATGIITTVAGNGSQGFFGDGGAATRASLRLGFGA